MPEGLRYALLALDVDGTLVTGTKRLLPEVRLAIRAAQEAGIQVVLATGRMYQAVAPWVKELGLTAPQIGNNGADIVDPVTGRFLRKLTLDPAATAQALEFGREKKVAIALFSGDHILTPLKTGDHWLIERNREPVAETSFDELRRDPPPTEKLLYLDRANPERLVALKAEFEARFQSAAGPRFKVEITEPGILNICHPASGKVEALTELCRMLAIAPERVAAIGDSDNDAEMLRFAGLGIAMANATPPTLAAANRVTGGNEEAGVVPAICGMVLEGVPRPPGGAGDLALKLRELRLNIRGLGSALIAFSGGVDSSLVLTLAAEELPPEKLLAVTAHSSIFPAQDRDAATGLAGHLGVRRQILETDARNQDWYETNPVDRCYRCKSGFYRALGELAAAEGLAWVVDGENLDDLGAHRPGRRAAEECKVRSPLAEAGLVKVGVRALSRELGLANWDRPANACLATRFPHGAKLTPERLTAVAAAEAAVRALGFPQVRVRVLGDLARIEVEPAMVMQAQIAAPQLEVTVRAYGFREVEIDPAGYRMGRMDAPPV